MHETNTSRYDHMTKPTTQSIPILETGLFQNLKDNGIDIEPFLKPNKEKK